MTRKKINIFLDLDGVMVDLSTGLHNTIGRGYPTEKMPDADFSAYIHKMYADVSIVKGSIKEFWATLPMLPEAYKLFDYITFKNGYPTILTATPKEFPVDSPEDREAAVGKCIWAFRNLSDQLKVITTRSNKKQEYIVKGDINILIDDYAANIKRWNNAGGIGILHTSVDDSIRQLNEVLFNVGS